MAPLAPPVAPMLAKLVRELPADGYLYEPKWDGFRCLAFVDDGDVDLRSRHDRPFSRYFPEVVGALRELPARSAVLDGEIVVTSGGRFDFPALMARLHPAASRAERLARETPGMYVAFDLLALGDEDLRGAPFARRRDRLADVVLGAPADAARTVRLTPATDDRAVAQDWLERFHGAGIDGVMAKQARQPYEPGRRAMLKVKRERTADCVVAGFRLQAGRPMVGSLLLGLYDDREELRHVGVATAFSDARRRELLAELMPLAVPLEEHPWRDGFLLGGGPMGRLGGAAGRWDPRTMPLDWVPLAPERVCEVAYTQVDVERFRHPARFRRWRPDRDPRSCRLEQLAAEPPDVEAVTEP